MAQTNLLKLDRMQNEAYPEPPNETMKFMLDLPPMQTRQKVEQVKTYFSAVGNPHNPLHQAVKDTKDADWHGASLGWVEQTTQYCKYAS